jgi:glycosyltransferase involved in cell wall biosynthesis
MLLSIGIPSYNRAENVWSLLHELLAEPDSELVEIFVIDDGGSDGTYAKLAEDAIASRVRILRNDANLGFARTFARLFAECRTEYLMLMSDDDHVLVESLRPLLAYLGSERPAFVSPQFLRASTISRGRSSTGPIAPRQFIACSAHAPGLVFRVEDCRAGLEELAERIEADQVDAVVYPQVHLVMRLLLAGATCRWLALPTVAEGAYRPSGIRDGSGHAYWSVESRWQQLKSYDALLSHHAAHDTSGAAHEMLRAQRERAFRLMASAIRTEDPVLGEAFDRGAQKVYQQRPRSTIRDLPIVRQAARRWRSLRRA